MHKSSRNYVENLIRRAFQNAPAQQKGFVAYLADEVRTRMEYGHSVDCDAYQVLAKFANS